MSAPDLVAFLVARLAEVEEVARSVPEVSPKSRTAIFTSLSEPTGTVEMSPARVLAEVEAKRRIVEWHKAWPVLVESPPTFDSGDAGDVHAMTLRMTKQIAWATEQEYREHFGTEPPTGPILRIMATVYSDHPDYREEWKP